MNKTFVTQSRLSLSSCALQLFSIIGLILIINKDGISNGLQGILLLMLVFTIGNILISGLATLQNRFAKNSWQEANDVQLTNKEQQIFSQETLEDNFHQSSYRRFRRFFIPLSISIISFIQFIALISIWRHKISASITLQDSDPFLLVTSFCLFFTVIFFLLSKYLSGLAYHNKHHLLRPLVSELFFNSILLFTIAITCLAGYLGIFILGKVFIYISTITISIVIVERIVLWLLDFYRPKIQVEDLPVYESRFLSLFSHSDGLLQSFSDIIQYQFGVKMNEKLLSLILKRYLVYAIFTQIFIAFLFSSIVYINPQSKGIEQNIITHQTKTLDSGLYLRLPYPFVSIKRLPNKKIQRLLITHSKIKRLNKEKYLPWSIKRSHNSLQFAKNKHGNTILTSLELEIFFTIENHLNFILNNANSAKTISLMVKQAINHYFAVNNFDQIIKNFHIITKHLKKELTEQFEKQEFGIKLETINIISLTPPDSIADFYKQFLITENNVEARYQISLQNAFLTKTKAQSQAFNIINKAKNEANEDKALYREERNYFTSKQNAFKNNPKLYKTIELMNLLEQSGKNPKVQKIVILSNKDKIFNLDLKGFAPEFLLTE